MQNFSAYIRFRAYVLSATPLTRYSLFRMYNIVFQIPQSSTIVSCLWENVKF